MSRSLQTQDLPRTEAGRGLQQQLLRVGWAAGHGMRGSRLRFLALVLASAFLAMAAVSVVAVLADRDGRAIRDQERSPRLAARYPTEQVTAVWRGGFDTLDNAQHSVISIAPLVPQASPPPGLARWPEPGEVMLSPALARDGADEGIATRYGKFTGLIAPEGLVSLDERLAYVRPGQVTETMQRITGFGDADPRRFGESIMIEQTSAILVAVLALMVLPAGSLLVVAVRTGSAMRDRRTRLLAALGGRARARALIDIGEAILPVGVGTLLATLVAGIALVADPRLPVTGYRLSSEFLARWTGGIATALLGSFVVVLSVVVLLHRAPRGGGGAALRQSHHKLPTWRMWLCAVSVVMVFSSTFTVTIPAISRYSIVLYGLGGVGVLASLPTVIAAAAVPLGRLNAWLGNWRGWASPLVAGRWMAAHPGIVIRLASALVVGLGLVTQLVVWAGQATDEAVKAAQTSHRIGSSVQMVTGIGSRSGRIDEFAAALPPTYGLLAMERDKETDAPIFRGSCPVLNGLGLACARAGTPIDVKEVADPRAQEIIRWTRGFTGEAWVREGSLAIDGRKVDALLVVSKAGDEISVGALKSLANSAFGDIMAVEPLGLSGLVMASSAQRMADWVMLLGLTGLVIVLIAGLLSAAAEFLSFGPALAPLTVLSERRSLSLGVSAWGITLPMLLTGVVAAIGAWWLGGVLNILLDGKGKLPSTFIEAALAVTALLAVTVGVLGACAAIRSARSWLPTAG